MDVYRVKKHLKGTGVTLSDNLTEKRAALYKTACDKIGYKNVWTWEGRIFYKNTDNDRRFQISVPTDIPGYLSDNDDEEEEGG